MSIVSYAQNFEDVLLWRALEGVQHGYYIDIGAQDPVFDSVSKGFFERGWRGLHVEPTSQYAEMLRRDRPEETVLQAVVSNKTGMMRFYEIPDSGMSTLSAEIAKKAADGGWKVIETLVPSTTLDQIFATIDKCEIHWLKIDVEGHEKELLEGWVDAPQRPWIVVIEAIEPGSREPSHRAWHALLVEKDYTFAYFDGVNRYYVSDAHKDLKKHFRYGPCLWDEMQVPEVSRLARTLNQRNAEAIGQLRAEGSRAAQSREEAEKREAAEASALRSALFQACAAIEGARSDMTRAQAAAEASQAELAAMKGERDISLAALQEARGLFEQERTGFAIERARLQTEHVAALGAIEQSCRALKHELDQASGALVDERFESERLRVDLEEARAETQGGRSTLARALQEIEVVQAVATDTAAALVRALQRNDEAKIAAERAGVELAGVRADLDYAHVVLNQTRSELADTTEKLVQATVHAERLGAEQAASGVEIGRLRVQLAEALADLNEVHDVFDEVCGELVEMRDARDAARSQLIQSQQDVSRVRMQLADMVRDMNQAQIDVASLHGLLDQARAEAGQAGAALAAASRENREIVAREREEARLRTEAIEASLASTRADLDYAHVVLNQARSELVNAAQARDDLERKLFSEQASQGRNVDIWAQQRAKLAATLEEATSSLGWWISARFSGGVRALGDLAVQIAAIQAHGAKRAGYASLRDLLATGDRRFVAQAYRTLLRREPDADGLRIQQAHLRGGGNRFDIVAQMRRSIEGRRADPNIPGLDAAVDAYRRRRAGVVGFVFRLAGVQPRSHRVQVDKLPDALGQLLTLDDEVFVRQAYKALLGRDVDPGGLQTQLAALRAGATRFEVVSQMRASHEGRSRTVSIPDLDRAIARARRQKTPVIGLLMRWAERSAPPNEVAISDLESSEGSPKSPQSPAAATAAPVAALAVLSGATIQAELVHPPALVHPKLKPVKPISASASPGDTVAVQIAQTFERLAPRSLALTEISRALSQHVAPRPDGSFPVNGTALAMSPALSNIVRDGTPADDGRMTIEVGHDWDETGYPAEWIDTYNSRLAGVGCATAHDMKVLVDRGASVPLAVIGAGVDHWDRITPAPAMRSICGKRFRFLHVSACDAGSGVDVLLESFGRMFGRDDGATLIIKPVSGALPGDVSKLLARLRLENKSFPDVVVIDKAMDDSELKAVYAQCHVFVAPARAEGFGLPIAKALLSGLPVVTTGWGGQTDYCDDENSWLVDYVFGYARTPRSMVASIWAEPVAQAVDDALWAAYSSTSAERAAKAQAGRARLLANYTWNAVSSRLSEFAHEVQVEARASDGGGRIGWVTTWNVKCGIATYSQHLLAAIPRENQVVFAARQGPTLTPDEPNALRSWDPGKGANGLNAILRELEPWGVNTLMIQFNYGFYNHFELSNFINAAIDMGKVVMVDLHSTLETPDAPENFRLSDLVGALRRCHRVLAHGPADMTRLKEIGLVNNVMLFPHGVMNKSLQPVVTQHGQAPMIASFGFCFANKGLVELVQAIGELKKQGRRVRLRMVNAEFPAPESADVVRSLKSEIARLGLEKDVELHTEFLDDDTCLSLLAEADLVVNPYQHTGESASGSVRYGLAIGRPVAVTPLSIFDDLGEAVFRMPGTSSVEIARGVAEALDQIASRAEAALKIGEAAHRWRDEHDFSRQGARLMQIAKSLARHGSHENSGI